MKKHVLFFASFAAPYGGNFLPTLSSLAKELKKKGYGTVMVLPEKAADYEWAKHLDCCSEVGYLSGNIAKDTIVFLMLFKKYRFALVHTHFAESKHILEIKIARALSGQKTAVVEHHRAQFPVPANAIKRSIKFWLMRNDYLIGCGQSVEWGLKQSGLKNKDISYIDNAIDFSRFPTPGCGVFTPEIMMFGYNVRIKGVDIAVKACQRLASQILGLKLRICVAANMEHVRTECEALLGGIPDWLEFLPPSANVGQYFNAANVFLSASREEGFCNAVVEASYNRCTVVSSRIDGPMQLKLQDITWFESENDAQLETVLSRILQMSREEAADLKEKLHDSAEENYQVARWVRQVMEYYTSRKLI